MSGRNLEPVFHSNNVPDVNLLKDLRVFGGSAALCEKLKTDIDYDGIRLLAAGIITTDAVGSIKSTHWTTLGALKMGFIPAKKVWHEA